MAIVSIIVAAYNAEAYLRQGLEKILGQTFPDFEVLLINDGSTDGTGNICDEFAQHDSRIRVFHEPHGGVAHARQVGIDHARGKYTIHVDADDCFEATMLEEMYRKAEREDTDLLICDYREQSREGIVYHKQEPTELTTRAVVNDFVDGKLYGALWNKLIRTSCFQRHGIGFRQDLTMREDMFFVFDVMPHVLRIAYLPRAIYIYDRTRNGTSLTNTYLVENRNYYEQEILWHQVALGNEMVGDVQKDRLRMEMLNYAYITLSGDIFSHKEWLNLFETFHGEFKGVPASYKKQLVMTALGGHYRLASIVRGLIAMIRRKR